MNPAQPCTAEILQWVSSNQMGRQVVSGEPEATLGRVKWGQQSRLAGSGWVRVFRVASVTGRDNKPANNFLGMFALKTDANAKNKRICTYFSLHNVTEMS